MSGSLGSYLLVFLGGGLGAVGRVLLTGAIAWHFGAHGDRRFHLPGQVAGTLAVNLIGSFLAGLLFALLGPEQSRAGLLLGGGLLGGFTTVSGFALQGAALLRGKNRGAGILYVLASALACPAVALAGAILGGDL